MVLRLLVALIIVTGIGVTGATTKAEAQACYYCQTSENCPAGLCNPFGFRGFSGCTGGCYSPCALSGSKCSFAYGEDDAIGPDGTVIAPAGLQVAFLLQSYGDGSLDLLRSALPTGFTARATPNGVTIIRECDGAVVAEMIEPIGVERIHFRMIARS